MLPSLQRKQVQGFEEWGAARDIQAEEILDLAAGDEHRRPGGEADHHGM